MLASILRGVLKKRSKRALAGTRARRSLTLELLEAREVPAVAVWTGGGFNQAGNQADDDFRWSNAANWQGGAVPQNGDDVRFPVIAAGDAKPPSVLGPFAWPNSSIIDINVSINNLTIEDQGFRIVSMGGQLTVNGTITGNIPNTLGGITGYSRIEAPLILTSNAQALSSTGTGVLDLAGVISGPMGTTVGLQKVGSGILVLSGANTFTGTVVVNQGTLIAGNATALGVGAAGTTVANGATLSFYNPGMAPLTTAEALVITGDGVGGNGALTTTTNPFAIYAGGGGSPTVILNGSVTLNTSASIGGSGLLIVNGVITGSGDLTKLGSSVLTLPTANTYQGQTLIRAGNVLLTNDLGLGAARSSSTTVFSGAALTMVGNRMVDEVLFLNGTGFTDGNGNPTGALRLQAAPMSPPAVATYLGPITLQTSSSIGVPLGSTLTIAGTFSGATPVVFRKDDQGTLVMPDAKTFLGSTTIANGTLIARNAAALGTGASGITVFAGPGASGGFTAGTLQLDGNLAFTKPLTLNGLGFNSGGAVQVTDGSAVTWGAPITLGSATSIETTGAGTFTSTGVVSGVATASLDKSGNGTLFLNAANTYLGGTNVREGILAVQSGAALGAATAAGGGAVTVANGATLRLDAPVTIATKSLTLTGTGVNGVGALLTNAAGASSWTGPVNLLATGGAGEAVIGTAPGSVLTFPGVLSGTANLRKVGAGELALTGGTTNSLVSNTFVDDGILTLAKTGGVPALNGAVTVGDNSGLNNTALLRLGSTEQILDSGNLTVNSDGLFNLNGFNETVNAVSMTGGEILTGTATLTIGGNVTTLASGEESVITGNLNLGATDRTFTVAEGGALIDLRVNAVISGAPGVGITKAGLGVMVLGRTNAYTGTTTVTGGVLASGAANALPNSPLVLNGGSYAANGFAVTVPQLSGTAGTVDLAVAGSSFAFGTDGTNQTFMGTVTGGATATFTKVGAGTQTLTGNSAAYAGTTNVNGGALNVTGSLGGTTNVAAGATLSGTGTVGTVSASGAVSPGVGTGTGNLTAGPVTFATSGQLIIDVTTVASDSLTAGAVNLNNATLVLRVTSLPGSGIMRTIVQATSLTGTLRTATGTVLNDGATFVQDGRMFRVNYTGTQVNLTFVGALVNGTLASNNNPATPSAMNNITLTYTATAQNPADAAQLMGTVMFFDVTGGDLGTLIGMTQTLTGGTASVMTAFPATGTRLIEARFFNPAIGDPFAPNVASLTQAVNNITATTVTAAPGPVEFGTPVTLTATVTSTMGAPTPNAGTVQFVNAATGAVLAAATVNASGVASASVVLPAGRLTIVAQYIGTGDFRASAGTVQQLVSRQTLIATGAPVGSNGVMQVLDGETRQQMLAISLFGAQGTKVAVGDVDNDGFSDLIVTQAAAIANPTIGIISGRDFSLLGVYQAIGFAGGVNIASGDVNGDGFADVIVGSATNGDLVRVYSGFSPNVIGQFNGVFGLTTGVTLAAGDIDGNGVAEIIVGTATQFFFAAAYNLSGVLVANTPVQFAQAYTKGVNVAAGDLDGDGNAEIVLGLAADPTVVTFDPQTQAIGLFGAGTAGGVSVSTTDVNGDGIAEIVTAPTLGAPVIRRFNLFGAPLEDLFGPVVGPTVAGSPGL
jgi:autotransporter-associated beta strand protein